MKKLLLVFLVSFTALGQSNSVYNANTYAYITQVTSGNTSTGSSSIMANPTAFANGIPFLPYNVNAPITINRNASTSETLTPSAISNCFPNSLTCTLSGTFTFKHITGENLQSGTYGLQEALNIAVAAGSGTVLIDASWQGPSGTAIIAAAKGSTNVLVQDNRNPAGPVFYQWNGTNYVAAGVAGAIQSINGDTTQAQLITCSGTGLTCPTNSGHTTFTLAGGGLTGVITSSTAHQFTYFPGNGTTVVGHPNLWELDSTMTLAQINTLLANLSCGNCSGSFDTVVIPDGVPFQPWTNTAVGFPSANPGVGGIDGRTGTHYQQMSLYGLVPDALQIGASITVSSTTVTGNFFCPNNSYPCTTGGDVGKIMAFGGWTTGGNYYTSTQYRFIPTIASVQSTTAATLSTASPLTLAENVWKGTDNCAAFTNSMVGLLGNLTGALASQGLMGQLPAGYMLTSCPIPWTGSPSWMGQNMSDSFIVGTPGMDVIDANANGGVGLYWGRMTLIPDGSISVSQHPYTNVTANGTTTVVQPFYRPLHVGQPDSNNPLGQGWCASCDGNYVANTAQNSGVICVPTALGRLPTVGDEIVFPYTPTVFQSVVNSTAGSCSAGLSPITILPAIPNSAGYTLTQTPFYASKASAGIQHLAVAIPAGTNTFPFTVTFANPTYPYSGSINNVALWGHFRVGTEQYDYMGCSYVSPYICIVRAGSATSTGWATMSPVVPLNPCYADFLVPYPVIPTVNSGQATPVGAVYFPGACGGNFGLAEPDVNGLTDAGGSFFRAHLEDVAISPTNINPGKGVGGWYGAGNHMPYATTANGWRIFGGDFGLAQGPASENEFNIGTVGPTGDGNHFDDWSVTSAFIQSSIGVQDTTFDRWDAYSTEYSPFDGSAIGGSAAFYSGYTLSETTGNFVQNTGANYHTNRNTEPENGSHIIARPYFYSGCMTCMFEGEQNEGAGAIVDGNSNIINGGTLAASAGNPVILYGHNNTITNTAQTQTGQISNVYGIGAVLNWGSNNTISVPGAQGNSPNIAPAPSLREQTGGYDSGSFRDGLAATPYVSEKEGFFSPYEFSCAVSCGIDSQPFSTNVIVDPSAPESGQYVGCNISPSSACFPVHLGGFAGSYYIGQDQRVAAIPYVLITAIKTTSNQTMTLLVTALDPGGANDTCSGTNPVVNQSITTVGGQYTTIAVPANFTGRTGCLIQFGLTSSTSADQAQVAYMDFQPVPKSSFLATVSSSIEGTSCTVPAILGTDGTFIYFCSGTVIKRVTGS